MRVAGAGAPVAGLVVATLYSVDDEHLMHNLLKSYDNLEAAWSSPKHRYAEVGAFSAALGAYLSARTGQNLTGAIVYASTIGTMFSEAQSVLAHVSPHRRI